MMIAPPLHDEDSPAGRLLAALGLETRQTAEVQDLYNRPIASAAVVRRLLPRPARVETPDLAA